MIKVIDRLKAFIDESGLSLNKFDETIGVGNGYIGKQIKRKASIGSDVIEKIVRSYPDLSVNWLITGEGQMLKEPKEDNTPKRLPHYDINSPDLISHEPEIRYYPVDRSGNTLIPVTEIRAAAGSGYINPSEIDTDDLIKLPSYMLKGDQHLCIRIKGQSMSPTLQDSGYLVIRPVEKTEWKYIKDNRIYVLSDVDSSVYIKRIRNRFDQGFIVCTSDNADKVAFPNFNLQHDEILTLWYVEAYITFKMPNVLDDLPSKMNRLEEGFEQMIQEIDSLKRDVKKIPKY